MKKTDVETFAGSFTRLSHLLLGPDTAEGSDQIAQSVANYDREELGRLCALATSHHVIMRALPRLCRARMAAGNGGREWVESALATEQARIHHALSFLSSVCRELGNAGDVIVIKSLDHWPDLGSDLDLYTNAKVADVVAIMRNVFQARVATPSWGDRLANKCNFVVPGLPELVEVHISRLGQTGEQVAITNSLVARASRARFGSHMFRVPSVEDRIVISTLQRMYRHFYIRLCDVADIARLINSAAIDYVYLRCVARSTGLWEGLCSYLVIVAEYAESCGAGMLPLPPEVTSAARLSVANVSFKREFLRIPFLPQAATLYAKEWATLLFNGELKSTLRLSLLPGLAATAALVSKVTGSDTGIW
jgi:hypothetical protein